MFGTVAVPVWLLVLILGFAVVSFAIIVTLRPSDSKGHAHEGSPVPAGAK